MVSFHLLKSSTRWLIVKLSDTNGPDAKVVDSFPTRSEAQRKLHIYKMVTQKKITEQEVKDIRRAL